MNSLTQTADVTRNGNISDPGWNLVGNPHTSFIKMNNNSDYFSDAANNFLTLNSSILDPARVEIFIWDPAFSTTEYQPVNHSSPALSLAPGQGFFIKANSAATVSFVSAIRTHAQTGAYKSAVVSCPEIKLIVENNGKRSQTYIRYLQGMTRGLDPGYDTGTFTGSGAGFSVYTRLIEDAGEDFVIQCLPDNVYENLEIPVGLNADKGSVVVFKAEVANLPEGMKVYLEDRLKGTFTRMDESGAICPVSLDADSHGTGRFFIRTSAGSLGIAGEVNACYKIITLPDQQLIRIFGTVDLPATVTI